MQTKKLSLGYQHLSSLPFLIYPLLEKEQARLSLQPFFEANRFPAEDRLFPKQIHLLMTQKVLGSIPEEKSILKDLRSTV